jgi:phage-related protein (TIGR01555 family)
MSKINDGMINFFSGLGAGANNKFSAGTYVDTKISNNKIKLENIYKSSWIIGVGIDSIAEDMTKNGIVIHADSEPQDIQNLQRYLIDLNIWNCLTTAIKWGKLYGGSLAFLDIEGQDPASELDVRTIRKGQFNGLRVFDRWRISPSYQETIEKGRDAGLPKYYTLIGEREVLNIHHSRVIRFIGIEPTYQDLISNQYWGTSILERLYGAVLGFDTATAGVSSLIERAHYRTISVDGLRDVLASGGSAEKSMLQMFDYIRMYQRIEGLTILDKSDEFQTYNYSFAGVPEVILQFAQQIGGAFGIPLIRLFAQSPAGLNSSGESDLRTYYDNIKSQQESSLRNGLQKILAVAHTSYFGYEIDENFNFEFASLWEMNTEQKSTIAKNVTDMVVSAFDAGLITQETALKELKASSDITGIYTNITGEQIAEAENEPPMVEPS